MYVPLLAAFFNLKIPLVERIHVLYCASEKLITLTTGMTTTFIWGFNKMRINCIFFFSG